MEDDLPEIVRFNKEDRELIKRRFNVKSWDEFRNFIRSGSKASRYSMEELKKIEMIQKIKHLKLRNQKLEAELGTLEKQLGARYTQAQWDIIYDTAIIVSTLGRLQCWKCNKEFESRKEAIHHIVNFEKEALLKLIPQVEKDFRFLGKW